MGKSKLVEYIGVCCRQVCNDYLAAVDSLNYVLEDALLTLDIISTFNMESNFFQNRPYNIIIYGSEFFVERHYYKGKMFVSHSSNL